MRKHYDYLVVGAGLFGAVFAHEAVKAGFTVLVLEKRDHIAGNIYTEEVEGIDVHKYGAHIFHTSDKNIWSYVDKFAEFNNFVNSPVANYKGEMYNMPFNMNTFSKMFGISTPAEAMAVPDKERAEHRYPRRLRNKKRKPYADRYSDDYAKYQARISVHLKNLFYHIHFLTSSY